MSDLPRGTVTLLFTDVEGSTALVHELGDEYTGVLAEHRRLVRTAVEPAGGHVVECRADEFFIAFPDGTAAVSAAVEAQRALSGHPWPARAPLRVRMGLHTGQPGVDEQDYFGLDVHRAARIASAAHGGQVLASQATRDRLGEGEQMVQLKDLGEHRLRGLPRPERIFQLVAPDLPSEFPPLRFSDEARAGGVLPSGRGMRVVLAEDSVLLREGIASLLGDMGFDVAGQAGTAEDLLLQVETCSPDVAIVDIRMPPTHSDEGLRAAREIRGRHSGVGVLLLSQYVEPAYAMELLADSSEGIGYLLKDRVSDVLDFAAAVQRVGDGGLALDPEVVAQLVGRRRRDDPIDTLTAPEREVLELMAEGRSNEDIAERLVVKEQAVEERLRSIFGKLRLPQAPEDHRRVLALLAYLRS
jgi:class 3 adenylate cyclase/DNA-binding NarL/FixJ family response regulator